MYKCMDGDTTPLQHVNDHPTRSVPRDSLDLDSERAEPSGLTICVICLDRIKDEVAAIPCKHDQFHFVCIGTWLQQNRACPLCKVEIKAVRYRDDGGPIAVYHLPEKVSITSTTIQRASNRIRHESIQHSFSATHPDPAISFRQQIYEQQAFSLYVGVNKHSRYRNLTPEIFRRDLIPKAKRWLRRELQVVSGYLVTDINLEFLLEYIIAVLKSVDVKGSAGQAQELLKDYLGRDIVRLFLHELEAWLRSPYDALIDWDDAVQYMQYT